MIGKTSNWVPGEVWKKKLQLKNLQLRLEVWKKSVPFRFKATGGAVKRPHYILCSIEINSKINVDFNGEGWGATCLGAHITWSFFGKEAPAAAPAYQLHIIPKSPSTPAPPPHYILCDFANDFNGAQDETGPNSMDILFRLFGSSLYSIWIRSENLIWLYTTV